jgi:hypothetical protein
MPEISKVIPFITSRLIFDASSEVGPAREIFAVLAAATSYGLKNKKKGYVQVTHYTPVLRSGTASGRRMKGISCRSDTVDRRSQAERVPCGGSRHLT